MVASAWIPNERHRAAAVMAFRIFWVVLRLILVLYVSSGQAGRFFYQGF